MYDILSPTLGKIGEVEIVTTDNHSIYWQEPGALTLIAPATRGNAEKLKNDNYIRVPDGGRGDGIYLIVNVTLDEERNELTVNGKTADYLLHQRAAGDQVFTGTTAGAALAALIGGNLRGLPVTAAVEQGMDDPEVIRYPLDGGALDEMAKTMMQYCGIGRRAVLAGDKIQILFSGGADKTAAADVPVLGSQSGFVRSPTLAIDTSDFANVAVGTMSFQSGAEEPLAAGETDAAGTARREFFCGEILQEKGETDDEFRQRAKENAEGMLADHIRRTTLSATIRPEDYGSLYRVGDIIRAQVGYTLLTKRIISATWLRDANNDKVTLQLGDQLNTVIAEIKEKKPTPSSGGLGGVKAATKEQEEKIRGILTDFKSLYAQVTDLVAGMDAYVINKVFEDYKYSVARLFAAMQEQDEQILAELAVKVSTDDLKNELMNYALASSLADYLTVKAAAELYVTSGDVTAAIGAYIVTDANGNRSTLAAMLADVIKLQGDTEILGNLSISDGRLKVSRSISTESSVFANKFYSNDAEMVLGGTNHFTLGSDFAVSASGIVFGRQSYGPQEITSTDGTLHTVLGSA